MCRYVTCNSTSICMSNCVWISVGNHAECAFGCGARNPPVDCNGIPKWDANREYHHSCTNPPDVRAAADRLGVPNPLPNGMVRLLAKWIAAGEPLRTPAEESACKAICNTCEHQSGLPGEEDRCQSGQCSQRGRALTVPRRLATYHCPEGKW